MRLSLAALPSFLTTFALSAGAFLLSSCSGGMSFYRLTPDGPATSGGGIGVGVGPVDVAGYLSRPNLVFQETENRLAVAQDHRWAGDLQDMITRVVATDLGRRLHTGNVRVYPWQDDNGMRYQIAIDIRQFHGTPGGDAMIDASWRVYSLPDRRMVATRSWTGTEKMTRDGYDELAAAESRLLGHLSDQIAASVR